MREASDGVQRIRHRLTRSARRPHGIDVYKRQQEVYAALEKPAKDLAENKTVTLAVNEVA